MYDFFKAAFVIMFYGTITTTFLTYTILYLVLTMRDRKIKQMNDNLESINNKIKAISDLKKELEKYD
tara:strand:- start:184 stop:384 length:201 start_codon:yes stop_codon:yes gene_type:complete